MVIGRYLFKVDLIYMKIYIIFIFYCILLKRKKLESLYSCNLI